MGYADEPLDEAKLFHEGLHLFNDAEWFEAHEVWEDVWRLTTGPRKRFYQGLIQCAVTIEHVRRGNPRGVLNVFGTAVTKFEGLDNPYLGVDWRRLTTEIEAFIAPIRTMPEEMFEPRLGRGLPMPVDLATAPKIELVEDPFAAA